MILFKGTIENGQVVLPQPADLPNGTPVTVLTYESLSTLGIPDEAWPTDAEGIARLVARMQSVEPFDLTPDEEADTQEWRRKVKEYTLAKQQQTIAGLFE